MPTKRKEGQQLSLGPDFSQPDILRLLAKLPIDEQVNILAHMLKTLIDAGPAQVSNLPPKVLTKVEALRIPTKEGIVAAPTAPGGAPSSWFSGTLREARKRFERAYIVHCLQEGDWNVTRTAEVLGIERSNLHRRIKEYGIDESKDSA